MQRCKLIDFLIRSFTIALHGCADLRSSTLDFLARLGVELDFGPQKRKLPEEPQDVDDVWNRRWGPQKKPRDHYQSKGPRQQKKEGNACTMQGTIDYFWCLNHEDRWE